MKGGQEVKSVNQTMSRDDMAIVVGENIDRLCTVEVRSQTPPRGVIPQLYARAREKSSVPLTFQAATQLVSTVRAGDHVLILTGAGIPPSLPRGETDGPPGAAALARALDLGLGAKPVLVSEERNLGPIIAAAQAVGLYVVNPDVLGVRPRSVSVVSFPTGPDESLEASTRLLQMFRPSAIISVEKTGPNSKGVFHSVRGFEFPTATQAHVNRLVDLARSSGVLTIGVGDNGNEIGCGIILNDVQEIQPWGKVCRCPCGAGIATNSEVDCLVIAAVSNWGAYGITALLAFIMDDLELIHSEYDEQRMLEACVREGAVDGELGSPVPSVDGISLDSHQAIITLMREIVRRGRQGLRTEVSYGR